MSRTLVIAFLLVGCGGKPAPQPPTNAGGSDAPLPAPDKPAADPCTQNTCVACLMASTSDPNTGSCSWAIDQQTCQTTCPDGVNCVSTGAKNLDEERAAEVCARTKPASP